MTRFGVMAIMLCLIFVLGAGFSNTAVAQYPIDNDYIEDNSSPLIATGSYHYPSGNRAEIKMTWIISSLTGKTAAMRYRLDGAGYSYEVYSCLASPGPDSATAVVQVDPQTQHRLRFNEFIQGIGFYPPATMSVRYYTFMPD